jgi:hypothetical protein
LGRRKIKGVDITRQRVEPDFTHGRNLLSFILTENDVVDLVLERRMPLEKDAKEPKTLSREHNYFDPFCLT